jgi:hypothetical protein
MAEALGEAVLYLRTDDSGLDRGMAAAKDKARTLEGTFKQSATTVSADMDKVAGAVSRTSDTISKSSSSNISAIQRESAQISQFAKSLATDMLGIGNLLSSSSSPFVAPVERAPAAGAAIRGLSTVTTLLGGVLETVAGVGVALFIASLIEMITKSGDASDKVEELVRKLKEHHEQTILNDQAQRAYDRTVDGSIEKMAKLTEEIAKQNLTLEDNINLKKAAIAAGLQNVVSNIGSVSTDLAAAVSDLHRAEAEANKLKGAAESPDAAPDVAASYVGALRDLGTARQRVADLTSQLTALNTAANDGAKALHSVDFPLMERHAKDAVDSIAAINHRFDDAASKAKQAGTYTQEFADKLEKQRKAALDAAEAMKKANDSTGAFGRTVSSAQAVSIARAAGLQVNSSVRPTWMRDETPGGGKSQERLYNEWVAAGRPKDNPVARPGTSNHEAGKGKWALDIQFAPGLTADKIKKVYADEGVSLTAAFPERGHFHIEGRTGTGGGRTPADTTQRDANRETERERQYQNELAGIEAEVIAARSALSRSAEQVAQFETMGVEAARKKTADDINAQLKEGKLKSDEAAELLKINEERAKYRQQLVDQRLREAQFAQQEDAFRRASDFQQGSIDAEREVLQSQEQLAKSSKDRHAIEQRLIDLQFQEERLKGQYIIDWAGRVQANKDATEKEKADAALAAQIAQLHLATLNQRHANATQANAGDPLGDFMSLAGIPRNAEEANDAFRHIAADGLKSLNEGLVDAIMNSKSLGEVFHNVARQMLADLIKLALQEAEMALFRSILGAMGGGFGGGAGGLGSVGGGLNFGTDFSSMSASTAGAMDFSSVGSGLNFSGGFATGGLVPTGSWAIVGERGPEPIISTPHGPLVLPNSTMGSGKVSGGGGQQLSLTNFNDFRGADPSAVAAISSRIDQMERDVPARALKAMQEARQRFLWK